MELGVNPAAILFDDLECVPVKAVHESPAVGDTAVPHEDHELVHRLGVLAGIIPEGGRVVVAAQVGGGITLLSVDKVREFGGVAKATCQQLPDGQAGCSHKNTGVLFATKSQLPSAVLNLTAKPRGSLHIRT